MGCLVTPYGPSVRNSCSCLTIGAELHMVPNTKRAHRVNAVKPTRRTSPNTRTHGDCTVREGQAVRGRVRSMTHTTTPTMITTDPYGARVRWDGARNALYTAPPTQVSAKAPQHVATPPTASTCR